MLWFAFSSVSGFPFPLWDGDDGAGGVSHGTVAPHAGSLGTPLLYPLHQVCNTPCPHRAMQIFAASPMSPGGSHGKEPLSTGPGGSPVLAVSGMTLMGSIVQWGASSDVVWSGTGHATTSSGRWCFAAMET